MDYTIWFIFYRKWKILVVESNYDGGFPLLLSSLQTLFAVNWKSLPHIPYIFQVIFESIQYISFYFHIQNMFKSGFSFFLFGKRDLYSNDFHIIFLLQQGRMEGFEPNSFWGYFNKFKLVLTCGSMV